MTTSLAPEALEAEPSRPELRRARALVLAHGWNATCYQILNPGIARWFSPASSGSPVASGGVVGYVDRGGSRVVAGSPVCAPERLTEVVSGFEADCRDAGRRWVWFAADERLAAHLAARGPLDRVLLGAQPVWDPANWPAIVADKASLRAQLHRARNKGVVVERWDETHTPRAARDGGRAHGLPALRRVLGEWLATRGLPPLHFLVEPETLGRLWDRRVYVASRPGRDDTRRVVGFLVASPIPEREGWLVEQLIRGQGAPNGTNELLLDAAFRDLAASGAHFLTLGLSPLSRRAEVEAPRQRLWLRFLLGWMRLHGRRFYDFDGLDAFKAKFVPDAWEPIYAITGERRFGPRDLWAIAAAFGQMAPPLLVARALARAVSQETLWFRDWVGGTMRGRS